MTCFPVDKIEQYCPSEKAGTVRLLVPSYLQYNNFDIISSDSSALPIPPKEYHALCYWFHNVRHLYYFMSPLGNMDQILPNSLHSYDIAHFYSFVAGYKIYSHVFLSMSSDKQYCVNIFYFGNFEPPPPYVYNNYRASFYFNPYTDYSCSDLSDHYHSSMSYKTRDYAFEEYYMDLINALDAVHPLTIRHKTIVYANVDSQGQTFYLCRMTYRWGLTSL